MANKHTTDLIKHYKKAILNHFGTASIYFMTNKPVTYGPNRTINTSIDTNRRNNLHSHLRVQTYTIQDDGFKAYELPKYYYVTSSIFEVKHILSLNLREDLIRSWSKSNYKSGSILLIDENKQEMYDISIEDLISLYCRQLGVKNISVNFNHDTLIGFDLALLAKYKVNFDNSSEPVEKYLDKNWHPEYIGNTSYSQHRENTHCTCRVYTREGTQAPVPDFMRTAKSLKQLYDTLSSVCNCSVINAEGKKQLPLSYKTFQRHAASNKPIVLPSGSVIIISKDLDYKFPETYTENIYKDEMFGECSYTTEQLEAKDLTKEEVIEAISEVDGEIEVDDIEVEKTDKEIISLIKNATDDEDLMFRQAAMLQFGFPLELLQ